MAASRVQQDTFMDDSDDAWSVMNQSPLIGVSLLTHSPQSLVRRGV